MVKIEKGGTYRAYRVRSGVSEKGPWELIAIKGDKGDRREMTLYVINYPSNIREFEEFKVTGIESVQVNAEKDVNGEWTRTKVSARVYVETALPCNPFDVLGDDYDGGLG